MSKETYKSESSTDVLSDSETQENTSDPNVAVKPKRCTTCKNPVRGHAGPTGKHCKGAEGVSQDISDEETQPSPVFTDSMMSLLIAEIRQLNVFMGKMAQNQDELKNIVLSKPDTLLPGIHPYQKLLDRRESLLDEQKSESAVGGMQQPILATTNDQRTSTQSREILLNNGARITSSQKADALGGKCVNLNEFLPNHDTHVQDLETFIEDGTLQIKPKKQKQVIDSFDKWLLAWSG